MFLAARCLLLAINHCTTANHFAFSYDLWCLMMLHGLSHLPHYDSKQHVPCFAEGADGQQAPDLVPEQGFPAVDIPAQFESEYSYTLPLRQLGVSKVEHLLVELQSDCSLLTGSDGLSYVFPPRLGESNSFNKVRAARHNL